MRALTLFLCLAPGLEAQDVLRQYDGGASYQNLGHRVADAGDVDGDGVRDHLLSYKSGAGNGAYRGAVRVHSGATGALVRTHIGQRFDALAGSAITGVGDVDGDGMDDYAVGATGDSSGGADGTVRLYSGATGVERWVVGGDAPGQGLGRWLARGPDLDGDGRSEVLAAGSDRRVWVLSGASGARVFELTDPNFGFGESMASAGDLDGDGVGDLLIGAPVAIIGGQVGSGFVRILSGASGAPLYPAIGAPVLQSRFGTSLAALDDLDGDGAPEFAVGSPYELPAGHVRIYSARTGALVADLDGASYGAASAGYVAYFGWSLACVGDVDGDGVRDLAIGAYYDVGSNIGGVYVVSTGDRRLLFRKQAQTPSNYGVSVAPAGDTDGDGLDEVLVGAPRSAPSGAESGRAEVVGIHAPGAVTCGALPNSTGFSATLHAVGSEVAADDDLRLVARSLPPQAPIYFVCSRSPAPPSQPTPSSGLLCLGGSVARLLGTTGQAASGAHSARVPLAAIPEPPGFASVVASGETWYFQGWYRETVGTTAASNFTSGLRVQFL